MSYMHIENLYKAPEILQCYALEKVHGTSAHLGYRDGRLRFFAGGVDAAPFRALFDAARLEAALAARFPVAAGAAPAADAVRPPFAVTIHGEAFGGKCQRMSATYGKALRFLAFDVKLEIALGDGATDVVWLAVPAADALCTELGIGFVPYALGPMTLEWLDAQRDADSLVAVEPGRMREGIVIRPTRESADFRGCRRLYKHKRAEFAETRTPRDVSLDDPEKAAALADAAAIADEWVTPMRLEHVLQKTPFNRPEDTGAVVRAMQEDVCREAGDEIVWSRQAAAAVGRATARMLHRVPSPIPEESP